MKTNIPVLLTDLERNIIFQKVKGKDVKSLVSRKELVDLVNGFIAGILDHAADSGSVTATARLPDELHLSAALKAALDNRGYCVGHAARLGFIRGWNSVGR